MCGIAGIYSLEKNVEYSTIKRMTDAIAHRGPDGEGQWVNPNNSVGLGHRRLSIIDLSESAGQPMHFSDGRYSITFNGEIYNYIELREQLTQKGVKFKSQSDTEVLLALYELKKELCLDELDGMFAFAIWDEKEGKLFCARDRFGEKPFHYHYLTGRKFVFGSEMKALWAYGIPKRKNERMLMNFLVNKYCLDNPNNPSETFFDGIQKLEAGHYLILDRECQLTKKQYWDIDTTKQNENISFKDASEKFQELMLKSVSLRLRSDVPVGSSLSGGLDSSTIVCLINQLNADKKITQKTFSARFKNFEKDEGYFMEKVIQATHADSHFTWPDEESFIKNFKRLCYHQEEPFGGGSIFAQWKVMELAKDNKVTVLLDGQGADEIMAGYHYYFPTYLNTLFKTGSPLYEKELASYRAMHNPEFKGFGKAGVPAAEQKISRIKKAAKNIIRPLYRKIIPVEDGRLVLKESDFLSKDFVSQFKNSDFISSRFGGNLKEQLYLNTRVHGLHDLLRFADRNSMAHSREVRLPFLSHHLVEFLFTLPDRYKIHEGWTKYILRKSFEPILPTEIAWRVDKIGYEPPQKKWMENPKIKEIVKDSLTLLEKEGIVNASRKQNTPDSDWGAITVANTIYGLSA
jgi:asparagine synthase (glutamine-hydrolysing)